MSSRPTVQRAELSAMILALEAGVQKSANMNNLPVMEVRIFSNSRYAVDVMTVRKKGWLENDFTNSVTGALIVNRDLIREAYKLQEQLEDEGTVEFVVTPYYDKHLAHGEVLEVLDETEQ